jgi:hypothetical protein
MHRKTEAEAWLARAVAIRERFGPPGDLGITLINQADNLIDLEKWDEALKASQHATTALEVFFYEVVAKMFTAIASGFGASASAASGFGSNAGVMLAVGFTFLAVIASIAGALFGKKVRGSIGQVAALTKA